MGVDEVLVAGDERLDRARLGVCWPLADVRERQVRKRRERLGGVRRGLLGVQRLGLGGDRCELVVGELGALLGQSARLGGVLARGGGHDLHAAAVAVVADGLVKQALEGARWQALADVGERVLVAQVARGVLVAVQPAAHGLDGKAHAVRVAKVALAQVELGLGNRRLEVVASEALVHEAGARVLDELLELPGHAGLGTLELKDEAGLQDAVVQVALDVAAQAALEHGALERGLVGAHERVDEDVCRKHALALPGRGEHVGNAHAGVVRRRLHGDAQEVACARGAHGKLVWLAGLALARAVKARAEKRELLLDVEVSVQDGVGVGELVVALVGAQELLVGERGDGLGVPAGDEAIGALPEQRAHHAVDEDFLGRGQGALHLVVDDAVERERGVCAGGVDLVVPALLLEDALAAIDCGVQHGVEVDVHEVLEVAVVRGRNGVHRLVRERKGVEERLHGALEQMDERLLDGEAVRAAQDGVLEDVEHARVVGGRRLERDGERLVAVRAGEPHDARARGVVAHHIGAAGDLWQGLGALDGEARVGGARRERGAGGGEVLAHGATFLIVSKRL